jgi:hypothetical protein
VACPLEDEVEQRWRRENRARIRCALKEIEKERARRRRHHVAKAYDFANRAWSAGRSYSN